MQFARGKVVGGKVVVEGTSLDEGAEVLVLTRESDDDVLTPAQEDELLASIAAIERGDYVDGDAFLNKL